MDNLKQDAVQAYKTLCAMLDSINWKYTKDDQELYIQATAKGDDLAIPLKISIDKDRQLVKLFSELFDVEEDKKVEIAQAICAVNYRLVNGCFDFGMKEGDISFRLCAPYHESVISEEYMKYILMCSCGTIDDYNDKLLALSKGHFTLEQFLQAISK